MTCDRARSLLQEHVEGLLKGPDREQLQSHVAACDACRAALAEWTSFVASLEALPEAAVPEGFADRVMADLPEMLPANEGIGHVVRWGIAVAVLVTALVTGLAIFVNASGPETARQTLQPLGASLHLGGIVLAQAATGLALGLGAMSETFGTSGIVAAVTVIVGLAALNGVLLSVFTRLRPDARRSR